MCSHSPVCTSHVRTVSSYQAWEGAWSNDGSPDLVILDVNLSERRGGYEILRTLRKQNKTIPVLMLSARNTAADTASQVQMPAHAGAPVRK